MRPELLISWRYLVTKRKEKFISLISVISVVGVAIGVAALIIVIGVMSGFDNDLREKIVGNYSDLTIAGFGAIDVAHYQKISATLVGFGGVRGFSPYVQGQVLLKEGNRFFAVGMRGVDPAQEPKVTKVGNYIVRGSLADLSVDNSIIIGKELAAFLGVRVGSELAVYSPLGKQHTLKVAGIFNSGMYDYDLNLTFTNIKTAQEIYGMPGQVSAVAVKLDNLDATARVRQKLADALGFDFTIRTWMEVNQNFFAALKLEKLTMFIILTLIILVASFNIVSTLVVMVVEKTKDIGILRAVGMTARQIRNVFTYEGLIIGASGTLLGSIGGVGLCALLKKYQFIKLPQDIYYINKLPVAINWWPDIVLIVVCALAISLLATIYPALKASGLKPVEALRYE